MDNELNANELQYIESRLTNDRKSTGVAYLLWFFLGYLGAHNFYIGRKLLGVLEVLLALIGWGLVAVTFGLSLAPIGILLLIDLFTIPGGIRKDLEKKRQRLIEERKMSATGPVTA